MHSILIIEDSTDIRENTAEILDLAGYKTFTAENGKKGVEMALREIPDIIICDIMMPVLDGYGVLHLLNRNEETSNIPFIFLTAKTEKSDLRKGMEMGADDYITKPFEEIELLTAIEVRLRKKRILGQQYDTGAPGISKFMKDLNETGLVRHLTEQYEIVTYQKKQIVYQENNRPRHLFYLVSGKIKSFRSHEAGKEYISELFTAGDFMGHIPIIEDKNYEDTAIVLEDTEMLQLPKEDFLCMMNADTAITKKFIQLLTQNIRHNEERLMALAYSSLRKRVANALLHIEAKFNKNEKNQRIEMSRDDMAHYVGTTTESLIRTLSDFKSELLINIQDGKIIITEQDKLTNLRF